MRHAGQSLQDAAHHVVMEDLARNDDSGGLIAVDAAGRIAMSFNSAGMYRGTLTDGRIDTAIF